MKKENEINKGNKNLSSSRSKPTEISIISKVSDYQTSISAFSTNSVSKTNINLSSELKEKRKSKGKKRVEFNPLITVINIQSYKKENYSGPSKSNDKKEEKCFTCIII